MNIDDFYFVNAGGHIDIYIKRGEKEYNFNDCFEYALKNRYYFVGWDKQSCKLADRINKKLYKEQLNQLKSYYKKCCSGNNDNKKLNY